MPALDKTQAFESELDETILPEFSESSAPTRIKHISKPRELLLLTNKGICRLELSSKDSIYVIGRFTSKYRYTNYIDLSPYGAPELGVSRVHAHIYMEDEIIYLTDLNSKNGTFISGIRMEANQPKVLESGAQIMLGRLQVQVMFNTPNQASLFT